MTLTLRDDQWRSVRALSAYLTGGGRRALLQGPTGWGKGEVAAYVLATRAARHGRRGLFICHREEITHDLRDRLLRAGAPSVRLLMGDKPEGDPNALVAVASIQTLDARDGLDLSSYDLLWIDEAHRAAAASYQALPARAPNAIVVGATATPARADGRPLSFFERLIVGPQIAELVAAGRLAPIRVLSADEATEDLSADPLDVIEPGVPTVVFASSVLHSIRLCAEARARGHRAVHLDGRTKDGPRREAIEQFNAGALDVIFNYRLLTEGVDLPRCAGIVLATRMDSMVAFLQSIGRGRRYQPGKICTLHDLRGSWWDLVHPDAELRYSLDGKAIARAEPLAAIAQCPACLGWGSPGACPCGAERVAKPVKPPRVTKKELREQRLNAMPRTGALWEIWREIVGRAVARGWKKQAAALEYHRRTGHWPRWTFDAAPEGRAA